MHESNAGQVFKHISEVVKKTEKNPLDSNVILNNETSNIRILVIPNKKKKNLKRFDLQVVDNSKNEYAINRTLNDLVWFRNNLRIDFPFSYVKDFLKLKIDSTS